jgi:hypothetical protein
MKQNRMANGSDVNIIDNVTGELEQKKCPRRSVGQRGLMEEILNRSGFNYIIGFMPEIFNIKGRPRRGFRSPGRKWGIITWFSPSNMIG